MYVFWAFCPFCSVLYLTTQGLLKLICLLAVSVLYFSPFLFLLPLVQVFHFLFSIREWDSLVCDRTLDYNTNHYSWKILLDSNNFYQGSSGGEASLWQIVLVRNPIFPGSFTLNNTPFFIFLFFFNWNGLWNSLMGRMCIVITFPEASPPPLNTEEHWRVEAYLGSVCHLCLLMQDAQGAGENVPELQVQLGPQFPTHHVKKYCQVVTGGWQHVHINGLLLVLFWNILLNRVWWCCITVWYLWSCYILWTSFAVRAS